MKLNEKLHNLNLMQHEYYDSLLKQYEVKLKSLETYKSMCCNYGTNEIQCIIPNDEPNEQEKFATNDIKNEDIDFLSI